MYVTQRSILFHTVGKSEASYTFVVVQTHDLLFGIFLGCVKQDGRESSIIKRATITKCSCTILSSKKEVSESFQIYERLAFIF